MNQLLQVAERLERFSRRQIEAGVLGRLDEELEKVAFGYWMTRAHRTFAAGVVLCKSGFAVESAMQLRSLTEDLINLRAVLDRPDLTLRFAQFAAVQQKRTLDQVAELPDDAFSEVRNQWLANADAISAGDADFRREYEADFDKYRWAGRGKSARQLAEDTGTQEPYAVLYAYCSEILHGSAEASKRYIKLDNDGAVTFLMSDRADATARHLRLLVTVFPLFWDEVSLRTGEPTWEELRRVASNEWFERFSRRPVR